MLPVATSPHWNKEQVLVNLPDDIDTDADQDMLHVMTTRFMQNQPTLVNLAKARLLLFEAFCLPTVINQNVSNPVASITVFL